MDWIKVYGSLNKKIGSLRKDIQDGAAGLPAGGKVGQVLVMGENGVEWQDADSITNGGNSGGGSSGGVPGVDIPGDGSYTDGEPAVEF